MSLCCCPSSTDEDDRSFLDLPPNTEIPVKERKQTDLAYFVVLVLFFSYLVICVGVAGSQGDIRRFFYAYDDNGNLCGFKNDPIKGVNKSGLDLSDKKYLQISIHCKYVWSDCWMEKECPKKCWMEKQCVKSCKGGYDSWSVLSCNIDADTDVLERSVSFWELVSSDLSLCWREIIVLCFFTICLSGLFLGTLRMFAKVVVRLIIIVVSLITLGWAAFTWIMVIIKSIEKDNNNFDEESRRLKRHEFYHWLEIACIFSLFTAVYFYMLYKSRHKIPLIAVLFEEGGKCIKDIPTMLFPPVLTHIITAALACFVFFGLACFETSGTAQIDEDGTVYFPTSIFFQILIWLLFFGFLWMSQFFLACQNLVIAGAVSSWYFSRVKGELTNPVWRSFCMIVKHHLGSSAFGSLLIAIIKMVRFIIDMMKRKSRENAMAAVIFTFLQCLLACIEGVLRILNKSAYVMIVLFGEPFCNSARRAYACLTADSSKVALIIGVGTFILIAIQLIITVSVTFVGIALFMNIEGVQSFWIPTSLVFILSFLCCHCFFSVYEMAIDTLILCFCVDHQMNNGLEKPYYMNENLKILFNDEKSEEQKSPNGGENTMLVSA